MLATVDRRLALLPEAAAHALMPTSGARAMQAATVATGNKES